MGGGGGGLFPKVDLKNTTRWSFCFTTTQLFRDLHIYRRANSQKKKTNRGNTSYRAVRVGTRTRQNPPGARKRHGNQGGAVRRYSYVHRNSVNLESCNDPIIIQSHGSLACHTLSLSVTGGTHKQSATTMVRANLRLLLSAVGVFTTTLPPCLQPVSCGGEERRRGT